MGTIFVFMLGLISGYAFKSQIASVASEIGDAVVKSINNAKKK